MNWSPCLYSRPCGKMFDDGGPLVMMTMMLCSSGIGRLADGGSHVESTRESCEVVSAIQGR